MQAHRGFESHPLRQRLSATVRRSKQIPVSRRSTRFRSAGWAAFPAAACALAVLAGAPAAAEQIDKDFRIINGTQVLAEVYVDRGFARFSNACGSQTLTQRELQGGAIPSEIIPCPRPGRPAQGPAPANRADRRAACDRQVAEYRLIPNEANAARLMQACPDPGMGDIARQAIEANRRFEADSKTCRALQSIYFNGGDDRYLAPMTEACAKVNAADDAQITADGVKERRRAGAYARISPAR